MNQSLTNQGDEMVAPLVMEMDRYCPNAGQDQTQCCGGEGCAIRPALATREARRIAGELGVERPAWRVSEGGYSFAPPRARENTAQARKPAQARKRVSRAQALVDAGLAANLADARAQIADLSW